MGVVRLRGHLFPLYVHMPPVCLDAPYICMSPCSPVHLYVSWGYLHMIRGWGIYTPHIKCLDAIARIIYKNMILYMLENRNTCSFVDFSFCCFTINSINFSLEQNISRLFRQTFIHYCELHQVWEQPNITAIIYVARTLWPHTLNSEHAQSDLWLPAVGYWLDWFGLDHYCVCAIGLGKSPIWAQGCYKDLCAIYDWGCTYPMFLFSTGLFTLM